MRVLLDSFGVTHAVIVDDYRWDRMCELREGLRCARPGERVEATHANCIACVVEGVEYDRVMRVLRGA